MPRIQYVGRKSLHFYGKYISEIARNLKDRGFGRVVVKESEVKQYKEPCFYILDRVVPLMSDKTNVRCRAWGQRIFRGRDFGKVILDNTHEPDWRLLPPKEAQKLVEMSKQPQIEAPDVPVQCTAQMPPVLSIFLRRKGSLPAELVSQNQENLLLLTPIPENPTSLQVPVEPSTDQKARIYPPYDWSARNGLVRRIPQDRTVYHIRRSDTPCLYWRVELAPLDKKPD